MIDGRDRNVYSQRQWGEGRHPRTKAQSRIISSSRTLFHTLAKKTKRAVRDSLLFTFSSPPARKKGDGFNGQQRSIPFQYPYSLFFSLAWLNLLTGHHWVNVLMRTGNKKKQSRVALRFLLPLSLNNGLNARHKPMEAHYHQHQTTPKTMDTNKQTRQQMIAFVPSSSPFSVRRLSVNACMRIHL